MQGVELAQLLTNSSPVFLFSLFIVALLKRWLVLPREVDDKAQRVRELEAERDEYKDMAFRALNIGERIVSASENRQ